MTGLLNVFEHLQTELKLHVLVGDIKSQNLKFHDQNVNELVGYLNVIHPLTVMIISENELAYLADMPQEWNNVTLSKVFASRTQLLIVAEHCKAPPWLKTLAQAHGVSLWSSSKPAPVVIDHVRHYLQSTLFAPVVLHGVFLEVFDLGVLLTGPSGVGKSELALELINRGHRLIADDAPEFFYAGPDVVIGRCPPILCDFLEVRGLGVLNVRSMFGDTFVKKQKRLQLIIQILNIDAPTIQGIDRLEGLYETEQILGMWVPKVTIPVAAGRNLAVLVEGAVRNQMLKMKGQHGDELFSQRQKQHLELEDHEANHRQRAFRFGEDSLLTRS